MVSREMFNRVFNEFVDVHVAVGACGITIDDFDKSNVKFSYPERYSDGCSDIVEFYRGKNGVQSVDARDLCVAVMRRYLIIFSYVYSLDYDNYDDNAVASFLDSYMDKVVNSNTSGIDSMMTCYAREDVVWTEQDAVFASQMRRDNAESIIKAKTEKRV